MTPLERLAQYVQDHATWFVSAPILAALLDVVRAGDAGVTVLARIMAPCPQCHTLGENPDCTTLSHFMWRQYEDAARDATTARDAVREARAKLDALIQERFPELPEPVPPS